MLFTEVTEMLPEMELFQYIYKTADMGCQGIDTVEDLTNRTEEDMIKVRNLGKKSLEEVIQKLHSLGLDLRREEE